MILRFFWVLWLSLCCAVSALHAVEPSVSAVLADGKGDFDPWNQTRWAAWYADGRLVKPFEIDTSVRFAAREGPWTPDVGGLKEAGVLLVVRRPGWVVDGNGVIIDVTAEAFRGRTLAQLYASDKKDRLASLPLTRGIAFRVPLTEGAPETRLLNFTMMGCVMGGLVARENSHPLRIENCTFSRNSTGIYVGGTGLTVSGCAFFENAYTAFYNGGGCHGNRFEKSVFRDNNYRCAPSYADMILDTAYGNVIADNRFLPSQISKPRFRAAFSFFRNAGEENQLREDFPRENRIERNHIDGYSIGINVGARHGRQIHDLSEEGGDYAADNLFKGNTICNTDIGIKVNTSGNTIAGNRFENVQLPIVLHCPLGNLLATIIRDEPGVPVALWMSFEDVPPAFRDWFNYQRPLLQSVSPAAKLVQVDTDGTALMATPSVGTLLQASTLLTSAAMTGIHSTGRRPVGLAVGDFYDNQPGSEAAVIWDDPDQRLDGVDYYDIIFYDGDGTEINRSGRSAAKWAGIAAGNFGTSRGDEVAAFAEAPVNGKYPVYIFRRGRAKPDKVLFADNPHKIRALAAGNFDSSDELDELAVIFADGPTDIVYANPRNRDWSATTSSPVALAGIASGRFSELFPGDQVAGIGAAADAATGTWPVYFFVPGRPGAYATALSDAPYPWTAIGAGRFDPACAGEAVAVVGARDAMGLYPIRCVRAGEASPFKTVTSPVLGVPIRALSGGTPRLRGALSAYERAEGFSSDDYAKEVSDWGECIAVLPSVEQAGAIPVFWLNASPKDETRRYLKVTPVVR